LGDFISEDDLLTFEGWLRYQAFDNAPPEELEVLQRLFDELMERRKASPKVGLMKFQPVPGEQKYAVAIRDGSELWLTLWVRCSRKGEIFVMRPRPDRDWDAHASYHLDGTFHHKSYGTVSVSLKRQPLTGKLSEIQIRFFLPEYPASERASAFSASRVRPTRRSVWPAAC